MAGGGEYGRLCSVESSTSASGVVGSSSGSTIAGMTNLGGKASFDGPGELGAGNASSVGLGGGLKTCRCRRSGAYTRGGTCRRLASIQAAVCLLGSLSYRFASA